MKLKGLTLGSLALWLTILSGCAANTRLGGDPDLEILPASELPAPGPSDLAAGTRAYLIGPYDRLIVDVFGVEELKARDVQVSANGSMSFPLVGELDVLGKTPREIEALLSTRLADGYIVEPQVSVSLKETSGQSVTIGGAVVKPGLYPVLGRMTLLNAMAVAGGTSEFAAPEDIVVFRTAGGQRYAALYDLKQIRRGAMPDPEIYAHDIVMVSDSQSRRLFKDILTMSPLLTTPIILLDRLSN